LGRDLPLAEGKQEGREAKERELSKLRDERLWGEEAQRGERGAFRHPYAPSYGKRIKNTY